MFKCFKSLNLCPMVPNKPSFNPCALQLTVLNYCLELSTNCRHLADILDKLFPWISIILCWWWPIMLNKYIRDLEPVFQNWYHFQRIIYLKNRMKYLWNKFCRMICHGLINKWRNCSLINISFPMVKVME